MDVFRAESRTIQLHCVLLWMSRWVVPPYVPDIVLAGWDGAFYATDVGQEVPEVPVALTALADGKARRPVSWPVVVKTEPQVDCVSDELLSKWELVKITDVSRDIRCSPDAVPVMLPSQLVVEESPDEVMARWQMQCDDLGISWDAQLRADTGPMMFEDSAFEPMSLPVGMSTETQVDVRWEPTSVVVPSSDATVVTQDDQLRTGVCPMMFEDSAS